MRPASAVAYLDTSAYLKLFVEEPESAALHRELASWPARISSVLLGVEAVRAGRRLDDRVAIAAEAGLDHVSLIPVDEITLAVARRLKPSELQSLDAIHLATAMSVGTDLGVLFTCDDRLATAASSAGLRVVAPS